MPRLSRTHEISSPTPARRASLVKVPRVRVPSKARCDRWSAMHAGNMRCGAVRVGIARRRARGPRPTPLVHSSEAVPSARYRRRRHGRTWRSRHACTFSERRWNIRRVASVKPRSSPCGARPIGASRSHSVPSVGLAARGRERLIRARRQTTASSDFAGGVTSGGPGSSDANSRRGRARHYDLLAALA